MELVLRDRRFGKLGWDFRLRQTALTGLPPGGKSFDVGTNLLLNPLNGPTLSL